MAESARVVHRRAVVLLVGCAVLALASVASADGDPASDVLYTQTLFVPFDTGTSKGAQQTLSTAISEADRAGYPIRVALIEKRSDLGVVTSLWGKPRKYARFLDLELGFVYKGPLLIVMPSGIGFARYHGTSAREYAALASIQVEPGSDGLALTATKGVEKLARQAGHPIAAPNSVAKKSSARRDLWLAEVIALAVLVIAIAALVALRWGRVRARA